MTAPTVAERLDAVTALFSVPFVGGLLLLLVFAVAYVIRAERHPGNLPLLCRLRDHGWTYRVHGGYVRTFCRRCAHLDPPFPR